MQDRIEEALEAFAKIDPAKVPTKIAYDYAKAWLMLATEQHLKVAAVKAMAQVSKALGHTLLE
jgi:hypothetical protein